MATETIQATDHKLYVAGEWIETGEWSEVEAPYDGTVIGRVPKGDAALSGRPLRPRRARSMRATFRRTHAPPCSTARPSWSASARTTSP